MPVRKANAVWEGTLKEGKGTMNMASGAYQGAYTYASRFEEGQGTNPEELIGAAHAGCFSMAFSGELGRAGYNPQKIETTAHVRLEPVDGKSTISIHLVTEADVPEIEEEKFQELAETAKRNCPVSRALASTNITLEARRL